MSLIQVTPEWLRLHFNARVSVSFRELQNPQFSSPCVEVDIVGYIVSIVDKQGLFYYFEKKTCWCT